MAKRRTRKKRSPAPATSTSHWLHRYCPLSPSPKQLLFLQRDELEVFFGGAAGGGKSAALLMGALQYVHKPGYAALIIRKDLPRLALAGGLIPRSHEWLATTDAKWNHTRRQWRFPADEGPPATITFGYLARPLDKFRYASSEFQYIAFDELTDFVEEDYLFLFSRLRRIKSLCVPLRMRSASNPGGLGHLWVKQRFIAEDEGFRVQGSVIENSESLNPEPRTLNPPPPGAFSKQGRIYIPSRIADNPALDEDEYRQTLLHLPPLTRERLMNGDWSVQEEGLIHAEWFRYFVEVHDQLELLAPSGQTLAVVPDNSCRRFVTIDPAGTSAQRTKEANGRTPSWTVAQVWDQPRRELSRFLLLRHQVRVRVGFDGLCRLVQDVYAQWRPERMWIEEEKLGRAVCDVFDKELPIDGLRTLQKDKATRAGPLTLKLERGEIFLPKYETSWRPGFEAELLAWTGDERQVADQIDAAAYAAIVAERQRVGTIRIGKATVH